MSVRNTKGRPPVCNINGRGMQYQGRRQTTSTHTHTNTHANIVRQPTVLDALTHLCEQIHSLTYASTYTYSHMRVDLATPKVH
jgi:hypothetical protein